jgi:hypothetical protein
MLGVHRVIRVLLSVVCGGVLVCSTAPTACAQEDFFKPVFKESPTKAPRHVDPPMYSFARFDGDFRALCLELEVDGRRARLV